MLHAIGCRSALLNLILQTWIRIWSFAEDLTEILVNPVYNQALYKL